MSIEHNSPREKISSFTLSRYTLPELQANSQLYESFLTTYCDVFNSPPWNENWTREQVHDHMGLQMRFPGVITIAIQGENIEGFFIGCHGRPEDLVPHSVDLYCSELDSDVRDEMSVRILERLSDLPYPTDSVFMGCDFAVKSINRGSLMGGKMLREAIKEPVCNGITTMYGMTMVGSQFHAITDKRGADTLFEVNTVNPGDKRIFKVMDMRSMQNA